MAREANIVRYSAEEVAAMMERGGDATDLIRVKAKSDDDIVADIAEDAAWDGIDEAWMLDATRRIGPVSGAKAKRSVTLNIDEDVVSFFEAQSGQWHERINVLLRAFMTRTIR